MRRYDGVIFDMDGTVIEPLLDFAAIRAELGAPEGADILAWVESLPRGDRDRAYETLLSHELPAARNAALMPGAGAALSAIRTAGMKTALLTRNAPEAMEIVLRRFPEVEFNLAWSRGNGPLKPEPDGVIRACRRLGIQPARAACVGDFHYDILAAKSAGASAVLLVRGPRPAFADEADYVIASLAELPALLGV